jgi:hypothetical protein
MEEVRVSVDGGNLSFTSTTIIEKSGNKMKFL